MFNDEHKIITYTEILNLQTSGKAPIYGYQNGLRICDCTDGDGWPIYGDIAGDGGFQKSRFSLYNLDWSTTRPIEDFVVTFVMSPFVGELDMSQLVVNKLRC